MLIYKYTYRLMFIIVYKNQSQTIVQCFWIHVVFQILCLQKNVEYLDFKCVSLNTLKSNFVTDSKYYEGNITIDLRYMVLIKLKKEP